MVTQQPLLWRINLLYYIILLLISTYQSYFFLHDTIYLMLKFSENFYWGTTTSSYQIEGNNTNNDWWQAEQEGKIKYKSGLACNSYARYEEDFDFAKELHNNAHRFSIEWSRIEPKEGKFNKQEVEHYQKVIQALRSRGIEPFITLHHFTNPLWFSKMGGWENRKAPFYFARYTEYIAKNLEESVKYYITLNEPLVYSALGYLDNTWPPFKKSLYSYLKVKKNLQRAHIIAYKKLKEQNKNLRIGIAKNNSYFESANFVSLPVMKLLRYHWNISFFKKIYKYQDFIGLNYYRHNRIKVNFSNPRQWLHQNENKEISDFGWEIYPEGIYYVVKQAMRWGKPIFTFENGIADADDDQRPKFIKDHLSYLHKATQEGADVRGYFHWSLLDNFEWAEGFTKRFGLVEVDFKTQKRTPRKSFYIYRDICKSNGF